MRSIHVLQLEAISITNRGTEVRVPPPLAGVCLVILRGFASSG